MSHWPTSVQKASSKTRTSQGGYKRHFSFYFWTPLCNRPPGINLIRGKFSPGQGGKERTRGDQNLLGGIAVFLGILKFLLLPKKNYVGATKNNTGEHLKIRGTEKNSNMRGHTKFLGGFEK